MDGYRFPFYLLAGLRQRLSTWWSVRLFAGSLEKHLEESWLTSFWPVVLLGVLASLLFCARLRCPLMEPEEARYAEIPRQMLAQGRWLAPVLHGEDYYQKPPLLYWLIMVGYQLFGVHDWVARLVSLMAAILVVLLTYGWARRTVGPRAALMSGVILCLSAKFLYLGGMVAMDSLLCLWVIGGLACGHLALAPTNRFPEDRPSLPWWLLSSLCCGLGIMTKGPVAAILVLGPVTLWKCLERRGPRLPLGWWSRYVGVILLVAGPWYFAATLRNPDATGNFFWLHNFVRYFAPFDHEKPAWFYLPGLVIGMLPWSLLLAPLIGYLACRRSPWARRRPAGLGLFVIAFLWCLAFFSLSGCKRTAYILPALPLLALILGTYLARAVPWKYVAKPSAMLGAGTVALALLTASHTLLPHYHRHYALRGQIRRHAGLARDIAVVCYPKRWDSVSFYLGREVECFTRQQRSLFLSRLRQGPTLLFLKNGEAFDDVIGALPRDLEFVPCGRQGRNVTVGLVQPRLAKS